jgi:hypothetical protein
MKRWGSICRGPDDKVSAVRVAFLIWMISLSVSWCAMCIHDGKLADIPPTVVHLTLALGATKVTHRIAEGNWEKVIAKALDLFKQRKK